MSPSENKTKKTKQDEKVVLGHLKVARLCTRTCAHVRIHTHARMQTHTHTLKSMSLY